MKSDTAELAQIWEVGRGLWLRDSGSVFRTIETNTWLEEIRPIMNAIKGKAGHIWNVTIFVTF